VAAPCTTPSARRGRKAPPWQSRARFAHSLIRPANVQRRLAGKRPAMCPKSPRLPRSRTNARRQDRSACLKSPLPSTSFAHSLAFDPNARTARLRTRACARHDCPPATPAVGPNDPFCEQMLLDHDIGKAACGHAMAVAACAIKIARTGGTGAAVSVGC